MSLLTIYRKYNQHLPVELIEGSGRLTSEVTTYLARKWWSKALHIPSEDISPADACENFLETASWCLEYLVPCLCAQNAEGAEWLLKKVDAFIPSAENMLKTGGSDSESDDMEHLELCLIVVSSKCGPRTKPDAAWLKKLYPTERLEACVLVSYLVLRQQWTIDESLSRLKALTQCRPPINDLLKLYENYTKTTEYFEVGSDLAQKYDWLSD